jgi:type II secretory pathway pseudopilin PulG
MEFITEAMKVNRTNQSGSSMVELMISTVIMGVVSAAFLSILLVNYKTNAKVDNINDVANAMRIIKERLAKDIREGRTLGDLSGPIEERDGFPGTNNPVYGGGAAPPQGWPAEWADDPGVVGRCHYKLNNRTLIVQVPILNNHIDELGGNPAHRLDETGDPTKLGWPTAINNMENVETHVYKVVPDTDPAKPNQWKLQYCAFPGAAFNNGTTKYVPAVHAVGPQTLLTGIIGPLDGTGQPQVFQYVAKNDDQGTPRDQVTDDTGIPDPFFTPNYSGVVVNLEVKRHQTISDKRKDIKILPVGFKLEVFLRNNANATVLNK